jgi:hypothetical protein
MKRKKKKKERNSQEALFPGWDKPCWLCHMGFLQLLDTVKG